MITLVIGGSASGKSLYAEQLVCSMPGPRVYLATMEPFGEAGAARIAKHRAMREGKGFQTMECTKALEIQQIDAAGCNVLLEDLPNLVANELFGEAGASTEETYAKVMNALDVLGSKANHLVIVTGDLASDGCRYGEETLQYLQLLGRLQNAVANRADAMYEVVAGIPIVWKERE